MPREPFLAYDPTSRQQPWTQKPPISKLIWEKQRDQLFAVFVARDCNVTATCEHIKKYWKEFQPSRSQLKARFKRWGFRKLVNEIREAGMNEGPMISYDEVLKREGFLAKMSSLTQSKNSQIPDPREQPCNTPEFVQFELVCPDCSESFLFVHNYHRHYIKIHYKDDDNAMEYNESPDEDLMDLETSPRLLQGHKHALHLELHPSTPSAYEVNNSNNLAACLDMFLPHQPPSDMSSFRGHGTDCLDMGIDTTTVLSSHYSICTRASSISLFAGALGSLGSGKLESYERICT